MIKSFRKAIALVGVVLILVYYVSTYYDDADWALPPFGLMEEDQSNAVGGYETTDAGGEALQSMPSPDPKQSPSNENLETISPDSDSSILSFNGTPMDIEHSYREVYSISQPDRKYFEIQFEDYKIFNPNIIPHPNKQETWIVVAQKERGVQNEWEAVQLVCDAMFQGDILKCSTPPVALPIALTKGQNCKGNNSWFNGVSGPHDARVFYGPTTPYILYGSRSGYTCFGQWVQDLRYLVEDFGADFESDLFKNGTELRRPAPFGEFEKNWFIFWDPEGQPYVHYDIAPKRSFAQLALDGSVGEDIASRATNDDVCMERYMPKVMSKGHPLHQASNSLSVTLCKSSDPGCVPNDDNTFIITIIQQKYYYPYHNVYRPYVVLFKQTAPFALHAISRRPFWVHGHRNLAGKKIAQQEAKALERRKASELPENDAEMHFITSMTWKGREQRYHGYLDDPLFVGFGIEDNRAGGIDVLAGDLLQDLGYCANDLESD